MELTKEQQKVINRYRIMPSFLKSRNLASTMTKLQGTGISREEAAQLIFQNSPKNIKTKHFDTFVGYVGIDEEASKEIMDFLKKLPIQQQDELMKNASRSTLRRSIGSVYPELQEKYFDRFIRDELSLDDISSLDADIRKQHETQILSQPGVNANVLNDMWDVLSDESKSKYYDLFLQPALPGYRKNNIFRTWGELDEQSQQKYMSKVWELYDSRQIDLYLPLWEETKENVQVQYLNMFINSIRKNENTPKIVLRDFWEKTKDIAQNSPSGKNFIENVSLEERNELYIVSNSEIQSHLLDQDLIEYQNNFGDSSRLKYDLNHANDRVCEMRFKDIFETIKQNVNYLNVFLNHCPDIVKEKNSHVIGAHFIDKLDYFLNSVDGIKGLLINAAKYLDSNTSSSIIENLFSKESEAKKNETDERQLKSGDALSFARRYWEAINIEKQRIIYADYIENDKFKEHINNLYNLINYENFEDAKTDFLKYFEKYNPEKKDVALSRLERINEKNNTISSTINFEFIASDFIDILTEEQLLRITHYPKVQEELVRNKDNKSFIKAFADMLKTNENWTLAADYIFENINGGQFDKLLSEISKNEISPEHYEKLCIILSRPNYYGITSQEDVKKYFDTDGKRNKMLLSIMRGEECELPESMKGYTPEELKRFAISEYLYGMDLDAISKYIIRFQGIQGIEIEESEYIKQLVSELSGLEKANTEELDEIVKEILEGKKVPTDYLKDIHLDSKAVNLFTKAFERGVYNPQNSENDQITPINYNGNNINVYRIKNDFKILARVEGAYNKGFTTIPDYRDFYDKPDISAHGNCESIIGQDQIALARNENGNIVVGYSVLPQNSIMASGPYDLGSINRSLAPLHDDLDIEPRFGGLQETVDNTRHNHNETVMERLLVDENGNVQKLRPSYLIWVEENKAEIFPPEFVEPSEDDEDAMKTYKAKVHLWEETQKAAFELGIPIVIINREECAEKESEKIEKYKKMLKGELELPDGKSMVDIAEEAIVKFENNAVGLEYAETDVKKKYFTQAQREDLISTIMNGIELIPETAYKERYEYMSQVTNIIKQERSKFFTEGIKPNKDTKNYYDTESKMLEDRLIMYGEYIGGEKSVDITIPKELKSLLETDIKTIANTNYYDNNKAHSIEHIEKVMLFSLILAQNEGLDEKDTKILLAAAAFHDSYREGDDGNKEHAIGSAIKAKEYFESNLDNSFGVDARDIPLIQVAIAYHEYNEKTKGKVDREHISKLCEEYGYKGEVEKAVKIATILKDADALDRERFATRGSLNRDYLRTNSARSRKMVLFSQKVNGAYAQKMINRNYEGNEDVNIFNAVKILQAKREMNNAEEKDQKTEETLSVDEMLKVFNEVERGYEEIPNDIDKKKEVIKAFSESEVTDTDIKKAETMLGIDNKNHTIDQVK